MHGGRGRDAARGVVRYCTWDTVTAVERIVGNIERSLANCEKKTVHPANKQSAVLRTTRIKNIKEGKKYASGFFLYTLL